MFITENILEFENTNLTVYEDTAEGHVNLTLKLFRPAMFNITVVVITASTTATGESCACIVTTQHMSY